MCGDGNWNVMFIVICMYSFDVFKYFVLIDSLWGGYFEKFVDIWVYLCNIIGKLCYLKIIYKLGIYIIIYDRKNF